MQSEELKLCPFCGGKPEFRRTGRQGYYIACSGCDSSSTMFTAAKDDVRQLLIETWNRRAAPGAPVKALEWEMEGDPAFWWFADQYKIERLPNGQLRLSRTGLRGFSSNIGDHASLSAAKAAAQAHYETRILSALSAQVQDVAEVSPAEYMRRHDAAIAAYEANTPNDYRYSALALRKAVDAAFAVAAAPAKQEG